MDENGYQFKQANERGDLKLREEEKALAKCKIYDFPSCIEHTQSLTLDSQIDEMLAPAKAILRNALVCARIVSIRACYRQLRIDALVGLHLSDANAIIVSIDFDAVVRPANRERLIAPRLTAQHDRIVATR